MTRSIRGRIRRQLNSMVRYSLFPHIDRRKIQHHLEAIGVRRGGVLLVHSSLSAFGYLVGGPSTVLEVMREYVGRSGILVFPTHSFSAVNRGERSFDVRTVPSQVGKLSETFRQSKDVVRSLHPSHSVCAWGDEAAEFVAGHWECRTPCGEGTPYDKLIQRGGQILLFGVSLPSNTCFHTVESMANVPYLTKPDADRFHIVDETGQVHEKWVHCHAKAIPSRFDAMETPLKRAGILRESPLGRSRSLLLEASAFRRSLLPLLRTTPDLLLSRCKTPIANDCLSSMPPISSGLKSPCRPA